MTKEDASIWHFFKTLTTFNKVLFGSIALLCVVGTAVGLYWGLSNLYDPDFLETDNGKKVHWSKEHLPITVIYHWQIEDQQLNLLRSHTQSANKVLGVTLFDKGAVAYDKSLWAVLIDNFERKKIKRPIILVAIDWIEEKPGEAHIQWDPETGAIRACLITISAAQIGNREVFWHELGHALGLRHDHKSDSIMSPNESSRKKQSFTKKDIQRIQTQYGD